MRLLHVETERLAIRARLVLQFDVIIPRPRTLPLYRYLRGLSENVKHKIGAANESRTRIPALKEPLPNR